MEIEISSDKMKKVLSLFMLFFLLSSTLTVAQRRIILKKNIQKAVKGGKTVRINMLTQDAFCEEKAILGYDSKIIYVVKYDFYLEDDITLPNGCVLEFDGGSLNEGKLMMSNASFIGRYEGKLNVILRGTNVTKDFIVSNYSSDVNKSHIETARNGVLLKDSVLLREDTYLYTTIRGGNPQKDGLVLGQIPNYSRIIPVGDNIIIENVFLYKPMPTEDVTHENDVLYSRIIHATGCNYLEIANCVIKAGLRIDGNYNMPFGTAPYISNIYIHDNYISIDFSHIVGDITDDVIYLIGAKNSIISNNVINAVNANRIFKITGIYKEEGKGGEKKYETYNDADSIIICNNTIDAKNTRSIVQQYYGLGTGKQVFDLYANPKTIIIENNNFDLENWVTFIENKSVFSSHPSIIYFKGNDVRHNGRLFWICDKNCTLNLENNRIKIEGDYLHLFNDSNQDIYNPIRLMAVEKFTLKNNIIDIISPNVTGPFIKIEYSKRATNSIYNAFYNPYLIELEANTIKTNTWLMDATSYDERDDNNFLYYLLGKRNSTVQLKGNDITRLAEKQDDELISLNNVKNLISYNNVFRSTKPISAVYEISTFLDDASIEIGGDSLYKIMNYIGTEQKKVEHLKTRIKSEIRNNYRYLNPIIYDRPVKNSH